QQMIATAHGKLKHIGRRRDRMQAEQRRDTSSSACHYVQTFIPFDQAREQSHQFCCLLKERRFLPEAPQVREEIDQSAPALKGANTRHGLLFVRMLEQRTDVVKRRLG